MSGPLRRARIAVVAIAIATALAIFLLWPNGGRPNLTQGLSTDSLAAKVQEVSSDPCQPGSDAICATARVALEDGKNAGKVVPVQLGGVDGPAPKLSIGDTVRIQQAPPILQGSEAGGLTTPPGAQLSPDGNAATQYTFVDFERRAPMLWLFIAFAILVVIFGRLRGALSLVGLGLSLLIILGFVVPAILGDQPPFAVAIAGSMAVMLVTIPLAHGIGPKSVAAVLGTTVALALTAVLALIFTHLGNISGLSEENAVILSQGGASIDFRGLLLAGMVIGALGVLDDVTVSQSSTVFALRAADPSQSFRRLFGRAMDVGRDHVSATVNTLVLAYAGAALPVLLIFGSADVSLSNALNLEVVAKEVVATLVGSIGLIAAVPITTALAAWLTTEMPVEVLEAEAEHGHSH